MAALSPNIHLGSTVGNIYIGIVFSSAWVESESFMKPDNNLTRLYGTTLGQFAYYCRYYFRHDARHVKILVRRMNTTMIDCKDTDISPQVCLAL